MSQLLAPTHTLADSIPLGRRINEIMLEKGSAYTISAMAKRLEINRETLRLMLKGEREIYTFELEKIAKDLHVSVERILQSDIVAESKELHALLNHISPEPHRSKELAEKLVQVAIGYSEHCYSKNLLAYVIAMNGDDERGIKLYQEVLPIAQLIIDKFGDDTVFWLLMVNLSTAQSLNKDYQELGVTLKLCERYQTDDLRFPVMVSANYARYFEFWVGDLERARAKYEQAIDSANISGNHQSIGIMNYLLGTFEYRQGNYERAYELFMATWGALQQQDAPVNRLYINIDYTRLLLRLGKIAETIDCLTEALRVDHTRYEEDPMSKAQVLLLLAIAKEDPAEAERIIDSGIGSSSIRKLADRCIIELYDKSGEHTRKMNYQMRDKRMSGSPIDTLLTIQGEFPSVLLTLFDLCILHNWNK
ncbi:MAG: helix-turn-helix domain-containing protein [Tumebacillaceae bacterium]